MNCFKACTAIGLLIFTQTGRADPLDSWVPANAPPVADSLSGIAYVNGQFVALGSAGTILSFSHACWRKKQSITEKCSELGIRRVSSIGSGIGHADEGPELD